MIPRICYLTGEYPRVSDTFIQREVAALRADGVVIDTFAVRRPGADHLTGTEAQRGAETTTYLLELAKTPAGALAHLLTLATRPAAYGRGLSLAWRTRRPGLRGSLFQLIYFAEAVILAREMARRGTEHLHNHFGDSSCTVAMIASAVSGIPYSFTLHGSGIFFEARAWRLDVKLDRAAFCACISYFTRSQAAIFAAPGTLERVHVVHCGVEPATLPLVSHRGRAANLVFVGRIVEQKGLAVLFDSMKRLEDRAPDLRLTIVGDGPDRSELERRAARCGLASRVEFVGAKSQAEVAAVLATADIFVLPSYAEGVPVVVMEALGSGIPVVASFVGGMAELVEDGVTGFLVRPGDAVQLADRIDRLLDDPDLRERLGSAGRAMVRAEFDSRREARRLGSLFANAAGGLPSPVRPRPDLGGADDRTPGPAGCADPATG